LLNQIGVPHMRIKLIVAVLAFTTAAARAQTPQTPQDHLESATRVLLNTSAAPDSEAGQKLATLQRDFSELSTSTLTASQNNWRAKYATVQDDVRALTATAGITDELRKRIEQFRSELDLFYTSSLGQPPVGDPVARPNNPTRVPDTTAPTTPPTPAVSAPTTPVTPPSSTPTSAQTAAPSYMPPLPVSPGPQITTEQLQTMTALLDRIDRQVADARSDKDATKVVGTSGKSAGEVKVTMNAAALDEIKAEVEQLKQILQPFRQQ